MVGQLQTITQMISKNMRLNTPEKLEKFNENFIRKKKKKKKKLSTAHPSPSVVTL